jgi:hypothetical protein
VIVPKVHFAGAALAVLFVRAGWAQVVLPVSHPSYQSYGGCPSFNSSQTSASAERCANTQRSENLLDGGRHFVLALGALGGYDDAYGARKGLSAPFQGGMAYTALTSLKKTSFSLVENTGSLVNYQNAGINLQYADALAASLARLPSPRTTLSLQVNNLYGNDAIRILPLSGVDNVEQGSYAIHLGRALDNQVTGRVSRQSTESRWWAVTVRNSFRDFIDEDSRIDTLHGRAEMQFQRSPTAAIGMFEETSAETGAVDCLSQSVGISYERRFSQRFAAEASAGPAAGSKGCISKLTGNVYGALSYQPARTSNLYVTGFRKLNDSALTDVSYENSAEAGTISKIGLYSSMKVRVGWIGGTAPLHVTPFSGEYYSGSFGHTFAGGLSAQIAVQHFDWSGISNISPSRTVLQGTLTWSPSRYAPEDLHGPVTH